MNSPIQQQFLREGWIQIQSVFDENVPVFFKYDPSCESYPFLVIFTVDAHGYYHLYDEWIETGILIQDRISVKNLWPSAYEHIRSTADALEASIFRALWLHYDYNGRGVSNWKEQVAKGEYYLAAMKKSLKKSTKNATTTKQPVR